MCACGVHGQAQTRQLAERDEELARVKEELRAEEEMRYAAETQCGSIQADAASERFQCMEQIQSLQNQLDQVRLGLIGGQITSDVHQRTAHADRGLALISDLVPSMVTVVRVCVCVRVYVCTRVNVCMHMYVCIVLFQLETEHSDKLARWKVDAQSKLEDAENAAAMAKFQSYEQVQILQSTVEKVFGFLARIELPHCNSSITCLHCECHAHLLVPQLERDLADKVAAASMQSQMRIRTLEVSEHQEAPDYYQSLSLPLSFLLSPPFTHDFSIRLSVCFIRRS